MKIIEKKINQQNFNDVVSGKKKAEFRLNDFDIQEGDILRLIEVDTNQQSTGRLLEKKVSFVWKGDLKSTFWPLEEILEKGIQIISLE